MHEERSVKRIFSFPCDRPQFLVQTHEGSVVKYYGLCLGFFFYTVLTDFPKTMRVLSSCYLVSYFFFMTVLILCQIVDMTC